MDTTSRGREERGEYVVRPENVKPEAVFVIQITRLVLSALSTGRMDNQP